MLPAAASVLGAWLGHANLWLHFPAAVLLLPAGLALVGLSAPTPRKAFWRGFWTATAAFTGCLYWIAIPVHDFGGLPWALAAPCPVLVSMYLALYAGVFCFFTHRLGSRLSPWLLGPACGALWAGLEALREVALTGFPWLTLASAFAPWPIMLQGASIVGGLGLGLLLATAAVWLFGLPRPNLPVRFAGLLLLAGLAVFGWHRLDAPDEAVATARIGLAQGSIDQSLKWNPEIQAHTVQRYLALSRELVDRHAPSLVIWPETALPFYYQDGNELSRQVREFAREHGAAVLTGSPAYTLDVGANDYTLFNRAYLITGEGLADPFYDKMHLLPFGEYVPFGEYLPLEKLVEGIGDFAPGADPRPLRHGPVAAGMLICYEAIFSGSAQERVAQGANLLVTISNDAWFGVSSAPLQHLHLSLVRAVEQGRAMARSTNTGISAFIDSRGRVHESTPLFREAVAVMDLTLTEPTTPYHRHRSLVHGVVIVLALTAVLAGCRRIRKN